MFTDRTCLVVSDFSRLTLARIYSAIGALDPTQIDSMKIMFLNILGKKIPSNIDQTIGYHIISEDDFESEKFHLVAMDLMSYGYIYANNIDRISTTLWASCEVPGKEMSLTALSLLFKLILETDDTVFALSRSDVDAWAKVLAYVPDYIRIYPKFDRDSDNIEPLIEKTCLPRILIDTTSFTSPSYALEAFISVEGRKCEVWSVGKFKLLDWMKPDMFFDYFEREDENIFYSSVDLIIFDLNDDTSFSKCLEFVSKGIIPVFVSKNDYAVEFVSNANSKYITLDGSLEERVQILIETYTRNPNFRRDVDLALQGVFENLQEYKQENSIIIDKLNSVKSREIIDLRYSETIISLVGEMNKNNIVIKKPEILNKQTAEVFDIRGWTLSIENESSCDLIIIDDNLIVEPLVERLKRIDVDNHFGIKTNSEFGFSIKFIREKNNAEDTLIRSLSVTSIDSASMCGCNIPSALSNDFISNKVFESNTISDKDNNIISISGDSIVGFVEQINIKPVNIFKVKQSDFINRNIRFSTPYDSNSYINGVIGVKYDSHITTIAFDLIPCENNSYRLPETVLDYADQEVLFNIWINIDDCEAVFID